MGVSLVVDQMYLSSYVLFDRVGSLGRLGYFNYDRFDVVWDS